MTHFVNPFASDHRRIVLESHQSTHALTRHHRPIMNAAIDRAPSSEQELAQLSLTLAKWYAARSSIRRLWAIDESATLLVLVSLEPTSDGDDPLPVWFAHEREWATDLRARLNRDVRLQLLASGASAPSHVSGAAAIIAELSWRDPWLSQ